MSVPTFEKSAINGIRTALGVSGLVSLVIGVLVVFWPGKSLVTIAGALALLLGIYAVVAGVIYLGIGIFAKGGSGWSRAGNLLLGVFFLIAGIVTFANLGSAGITLVWLLGILIGIVWITEGVVSFTTLREVSSKGWAVFYAVVSIIAGIWLIIAPFIGVAFLWWFTGFALAALGIVQIARAFTFGRRV